jgi:hypothetical protein
MTLVFRWTDIYHVKGKEKKSGIRSRKQGKGKSIFPNFTFQPAISSGRQVLPICKFVDETSRKERRQESGAGSREKSE